MPSSKPTAYPSDWLAGEHLYWPESVWRKLQLVALQKHLRNAAKSELYRHKLPRMVRSVDALHVLATTSKDDVTAIGRDGLACPKRDLREWVTTSGTTGAPLMVPLASEDMQRLAANEAVALSVAGIKRGMTVLSLVAMDRQFVAGLAYWLGVQKLGAACIRAGPQAAYQFESLVALLQRYRPEFIITVPTIITAHAVASVARVKERAFAGVKGVVCIGEPIRRLDGKLNSIGSALERIFPKASILSTYATTETCATFAEGPNCGGGHLNPQMAIVELLNDAGLPVEAGQPGEVVITPLGSRALPLVRFRTGDIAMLLPGRCPCGRTTPRLSAILGRKNQMLKVRGVSLFPGAIIDLILAQRHVEDCLVSAQAANELSDLVVITVALRRDTAEARRDVTTRMQSLLRMKPKMAFVEIETLRRMQHATGSRKPLRFIDERVGAGVGALR
ncbi:MAG: AMP-binding protein [Phycisphaerales bacterium]|nr:AMP-binding protein [Phycisphaerales bacterium]